MNIKPQLSSCGLSRQKIEYLKILAKKFDDKPNLD